MEIDRNKVTSQEAAEALNKISLYCEETRCSRCIFSIVSVNTFNKNEEYRCILGEYHPYLLRFVDTKDGGHVVTEWEKENLENEN